MVLVYTACLSTLFAFVMIIILDIDGIIAIDTVINTICVMMMSPYYTYIRDKKGKEWMYRFWCRPCIYCFCQKRYCLDYYEKPTTERLNSARARSPTDTHTQLTNTETMSLPRVFGKGNNSNGVGNESNDQNQRLSEVAADPKLRMEYSNQSDINQSVEMGAMRQITKPPTEHGHLDVVTDTGTLDVTPEVSEGGDDADSATELIGTETTTAAGKDEENN